MVLTFSNKKKNVVLTKIYMLVEEVYILYIKDHVFIIIIRCDYKITIISCTLDNCEIKISYKGIS